MRPLSADRGEWLRKVHLLGLALRRPPYPVEIARATGTQPKSAGARVRLALRDGHVLLAPRPSAFAAPGVRVTPLAMLEAGIPALVYLAWPHAISADGDSSAIGHEVAARLAEELSIVAVSPYLVRETAGLSCVNQVASALAMVSDAVILWRDPLLIGRDDVDSARRSGIPVASIPQWPQGGILSAYDLWIPPYLVPP